MRLVTPFLVSGALLAAMTVGVGAQPLYPPFPYYGPPPSVPPAWNYDPYASGLGPCPQRHAGDPPCSAMVEPSFGQPDFWPTR